MSSRSRHSSRSSSRRSSASRSSRHRSRSRSRRRRRSRNRRSKRDSRSRSRSRPHTRRTLFRTPTPDGNTDLTPVTAQNTPVTPAQISTILRSLISAANTPGGSQTSSASSSSRFQPQQMLKGNLPTDLKFRCLKFLLGLLNEYVNFCADGSLLFCLANANSTHICYDSITLMWFPKPK